MTDKLLFFSFSKKSSGELTYLLNHMELVKDFTNITICANEVNQTKLKNHNINSIYYKAEKITAKELIDIFYNIVIGFSYIFIIDLNCFFSEFNISDVEKEYFYNSLNKLNNQKIKIAAIDYFNAFVRDMEKYELLLHQANDLYKEKIKGLQLNNKLSWYYTNFVFKRIKNQIIYIPEYITIFAPVPLNTIKNDNRLYYKNNLISENIENKTEQKREIILFALSSFISYTLNNQDIYTLCHNLFSQLCNSFKAKKVLCIDPTDSLKNEKNNEYEIEIRKWVDGKELVSFFPKVIFTGLFVPYGTLGSISVNNNTPFVYFYSSQSSALDNNFRYLIKNTNIPGFNALGLWEDEAFFSELVKDNPYFECINGCDISDIKNIESLPGTIKLDKAFIKYSEKLSNFENLLYNWYDYAK